MNQMVGSRIGGGPNTDCMILLIGVVWKHFMDHKDKSFETALSSF